MMSHRRRTVTGHRLSAGLLVLQSVILLQFPLLNVLGLEFSAATAPLVSLLMAFAVLRMDLQSEALRKPYTILGDVFRSEWLIVVLPGAIAFGNWIFVTNCTPFQGALFYLLIVPFAAAYGGAIALLAKALTPGSPRSMSVVLIVLTILHIPAVTFFGPQIYAFNPILGFFPGLSYDSTFPVLGRLVLFRVITLVLIVALCELVRVLADGNPRGVREIWERYRTAGGFWLIVVIAWIGSDWVGFSSSLSRIDRELGGKLQTQHFIILYPQERMSEEEAARFGEYHEFLYRNLARTLRVQTDRPIVAAYYDNPAQKSELVGGGGTNFTKPWLWQMHLAFDDRERVLKHELVHVLAAEFGFPLVRIGWNSGFIEGLAVALERENYRMPLDRAAAAISHVRGGADLASVFSLTGFFRSHPSISYSLAGSFCRYLIDQYGVRRFKRAYRTGSFSSYGRSFSTLVEEWERSLRRIRLTDDEILKARYLFDRPPGFTEECFQYKGNALRDARSAMRRGEDSLAVIIARGAYERTPSFDAAYVLVQSLVRIGGYEEARRMSEAQFRSDTTAVYLPLSLVTGDALWALDSLGAAFRSYDLVRRADLSDGWTEAAAFRMSVLERFGSDPDVRDAVISSMSDSARRSVFRHLAVRYDQPIMWYGLARWLSGSDQEGEIRDVLERALPVDNEFLQFVVQRRLASAFRSQGRYEEAKAALWESQNNVASEVRRREVLEGIAWIEWLQGRRPSGSP